MLKRPIAGVFSMSNIAKLEYLIDDVIISFAKKLDEKFISAGGQEQVAAIDSWVHYCMCGPIQIVPRHSCQD